MTKIKDLVTVIVDNAFARFPVDSERYELCVLLEENLNDVLQTPQIRLPLVPPDTRAKEWLSWATELIQEAVMASLIQMNDIPLSRKHAYLVRRLNACLPNESHVEFMENVVRFGKDFHSIVLLGQVSARLRKSNA